jgi:hypothetical protein
VKRRALALQLRHPMKLAFDRESRMEHDLVLTRKDGSARHFRIYGRSAPNVGDIVTLAIDGQLIKARKGEVHCVTSSRVEKEIIQSVDHLDAAELEEV